MSVADETRHKHPCVSCGTGYLDCAGYALAGKGCCAGCEHPTRWQGEPYTADEIEAMWDGKEMPPHVVSKISDLRS